MKYTPILFKGEMVRAILAGRKTQTRRMVKPQPPGDWEAPPPCPYGAAGDRLWVKETWFRDEMERLDPGGGLHYRANATDGDEQWFRDQGWSWRPPIYMPRWANRITLEIIDIRLEPLQDISEQDAMAEGVTVEDSNCCAVGAFKQLWNTINARRGLGWSEDPWVWVVRFRRVEEDA